ncbi:fatty acid desaturase [Pleurocapsa sp. CCALA 161]|uniref:fatty acid desaturase family protein n=1 Tax=Pleurocapsa sp. CCALA 161 TaxID=2107688 RepID=UPI000D084638|nr:fatty acid desaturase family protein [Pleurocapsa sp. CCALA 161]PSB08980.1 fatty acid desaturase [Pleurocapsa sp. CCALA 161]
MNSRVTIKSKSAVKPKQILDSSELKTLNARSNWRGLWQFTGHLGVMLGSGYLWATVDNWIVKIPALIIYGFTLAVMFAPLHESSHRTAFANNHLNDTVAWIAGLLSFYNSDFYRRYHKWHHRYAQVKDKDPELDDSKPSNFREYLIELSGFNWWIGKFKSHYKVATGKLEDYAYIAENARDEVIRSTRLQLAIYGIAIAVSLIFKQPWFLTLWLLPLAVGQPILRFILLAEHTGCTYNDNPLTNTRTTLTWFPLMLWNIPFHGSHHLYPSIPFHALPQAHQKLQKHFTLVEDGYIKVHRDIVANF